MTCSVCGVEHRNRCPFCGAPVTFVVGWGWMDAHGPTHHQCPPMSGTAPEPRERASRLTIGNDHECTCGAQITRFDDGRVVDRGTHREHVCYRYERVERRGSQHRSEHKAHQRPQSAPAGKPKVQELPANTRPPSRSLPPQALPPNQPRPRTVAL